MHSTFLLNLNLLFFVFQEGEEKIIHDPRTMIQYYIEVVSTEVDVNRFVPTVKAYQYSVKENVRQIDHDSGSHGVPGLYFKYDMSALKIHVLLKRDNAISFVTRLCAIIAGIIVTAGFVNSLIQYIIEKAFYHVSSGLVLHIQDIKRHQLQPISLDQT